CYTACDDPHPHYYFGSPEMKVIANDRVFIDPVILYVEDVPVFILPVGIYFENNRGRRSGILVPQLPPSYQVNQGWIIPNMGYYWAISDYFDNKTTMTIFTKGGVVFNNLFRYNLRDKLNGDITLSYGLRRSSPDADRTVEWGLRATHSQTLIPDVSNISANINLTSTSFIRNFSTSLQDRLQQQLFSDAQYSYRFQNNSNFGITMQASQNLLTRENRVAPNISYSIPQIFPLKGLLQKYKIVESSHWLNDIGITYSVNANYSRSLTRLITPITGENRSDTSLRVGETFMTISHAPTISISPKLGFFSVTPSISYQERWFFRSINRRFNEQNTFVEDTTYSLAPLREFLYSFNLNVTTTLYGIMKPRLWGINALRHTFRPSLTLSYQPGFDENSTSYFSSYTDTTVQSDGTRRNVIYSKYALDGGIGITRASQRINYTFTNSIEAKIAQAHDTIPDKNLELLRFDISGNYDFLADSLQFSDININFRTPALSFINFNGSASFTLYDQIVINNSPRRINSFLASSRGTALRLTSISGNFSFSFSSQG
ncbi:MAG TPA: putative LPS assembly protein LptD, partial [Candidatus Kapabacteria bacterium]|nr:putative LPS assembly protein LptD [Candidatus Kapabacteria bacterium]